MNQIGSPPPLPQRPGDETVRPVSRLSRMPFIVVAVLLLAALAWGAWVHWSRNHAAAEAQSQAAEFVPTVRTAAVVRQDGPIRLTLPGNAAPFDTANIFARSTGYIAERLVDIGSRVHAGDLLVRIAAPDLDKQLAEARARLAQTTAQWALARADVDQANSNAVLAKVTNNRTSALAHEGWSSMQQADTTHYGLAASKASVASTQAAVAVAEATVRQQVASVQRLEQLVGFEGVSAPFDGVVTARYVDVGDLVTSDNNQAGQNLLFTIARETVLRIQVDVPQSEAVGVRDGLPATVRMPEMPDRVFRGTVSRSAVALNPNSRALSIEVDVQNPDSTLRPGSFVDIDVAVPRANPAVIVPAEAIIFNGSGVHVATVRKDGTVELHAVTMGRDNGTAVQVTSGLHGGENVITNPPPGLENGAHVRVADTNESNAP